MSILLCTVALGLPLIGHPAVATLSDVEPPRAQALSPLEVAALQARFEPSLGSLRAGGDNAPALLEAGERSHLAAAQHQSPSLAAMRAGGEPTDNEWKWLAIGAGIVFLIVLI